MASLDSLQIDLTLNYDAFVEEVKKARANLDSTFKDADKVFNKLNSSVTKIEKAMSNSSTSADKVAKLISNFKVLDGVSKQVAKDADNLFEKYNNADFSGVKQYIEAIRNGLKEVTFSQEQRIQYLDELNKLETQYAENQAKKEKALADARAEANKRLSESTQGLSVDTDMFKKEEEQLIELIARRNQATTDLLNVSNKVVESEDKLAKIKANKQEKYYKDDGKGNSVLNTEAVNKAKADFEQLTSSEKAAEAEVAKLNKEYATLQNSIQKISDSIDKTLSASGTKATNYIETEVKDYLAAEAAKVKAAEDADAKIRASEEKREAKYAANWEKITHNQRVQIEKEAESAQKAIAKQAEKAADESIQSFSSIANYLTSMAASVGITRSLKEIVSSAGSAEKATRRLESVFGSFAEDAKSAAESLAESYGLSETAAAQTLGYVGNLMTSYGMTKAEALDLSESIVALGADLSSFSGGVQDTSQAVESLTMALLGQYRATKDLGVAITDVEVKNMAKSMGMATDNLTQAQLAMLRYKVIVSQTKNVVGDFARSQDTYYVATQKAKAAVEDLKVALGEEFLPVITECISSVAKIVKTIADSPVLSGLLTNVLSLVATYGALATVIKPVIKNIELLKNGLKATSVVTSALGEAAETAADGVKVMTANQLSWNSAVSASKIGLIVTVITTLITALAGIAKKSAEAEEALRDFSGKSDNAVTALSEYNKYTKEQASGIDDVTAKIKKYKEEAKLNDVVKSINEASDAYKAQKDEINSLMVNMSVMQQRIDYFGEKIANGKTTKYNTKYYDEALESLSEYTTELDSLTAEQQKGIDNLARMYVENSDVVEQALSKNQELLDLVKKQAVTYQNVIDNGYDIDDMLTILNYDTTELYENIEDVKKALKELELSRWEDAGEYGKVLEHNIALLKEEKDVLVVSQNKRLQYQRDMVKTSAYDFKGDGTFDASVFMSNYDVLVKSLQSATDAATREIAEKQLRSLLSTIYSEDEINAYVQVVKDRYAIDEWYNLEKQKLEEEYDDELYKKREELSDRLIDLERRQNETIAEQRQSALDELGDDYDEYVKRLYASFGGKSALGVSDEQEALFEKMYSSAKKGVGGVKTGIDDNGASFVQMGNMKLYGEEIKAFFDDLLVAYTNYKKGEASINDEYNSKITDAQATQAKTIASLTAELSKNRETQYKAELAALDVEQQERLDKIATSGEDEVLIKEEIELKKQKITQAYNEESANILKEQNAAIAELEAETSNNRQKQYEQQIKALQDECDAAVAAAAETGKNVDKIKEEYRLRELSLTQEFNEETTSILRDQQTEILNLKKSATKDVEKQYAIEKQLLDDELAYELENTAKTGKSEEDLLTAYNLKVVALKKSKDEKLRALEVETNDRILDSRKALTTSADIIYAIEMEKLKEWYEDEKKAYEEQNLDLLALEEEYNNKALLLEKNRVTSIRKMRESLYDEELSRKRESVSRWSNNNISTLSVDNVLADVTTLYEVVNTYSDALLKLQRGAYDAIDATSATFGTKLSEDAKKLLDNFRKAIEDEDFVSADKILSQIKKEFADVGAELEKQLGTALDDCQVLSLQKAKAIGNVIAGAITGALDSVNTLITAFEDNYVSALNNQLDAMNSQYDALKELMDKRNDSIYDGMTVAQKDALKRQEQMDNDELARQEALIAEQEQLIEDQERKQWERQKAFNIASATVTGIMSALNAYAGGMAMAPYLGIAAPSAAGFAAALAAMSLAFTGAQVAAIAAQQYPSYAVGAYELPQDQMAQVHKGEMIIPRPFAEEIRNQGGFGSGELIVNVYGATDDVSVEESDSDNVKQLDIYMTNRIKQMVARGELDSSLQTRYAISRNGKRG